MSYTIRYDDAKHHYWVNGVPVPSVTTVLDRTTPKPALTWWGMRVGLAAVVELVQSAKFNWPALLAEHPADIRTGKPLLGPSMTNKQGKSKTPLELATIVNKLDVNNIRDTAADKGTVLHDALAVMSATGDVPSLSEYPEEMRPYVQSLATWWLDQEPTWPVDNSVEVIVGSREHRYAGRFDGIVQLGDRRVLMDLKTGGTADYPELDKQLPAYRLAFKEMTDTDVDEMLVVHLTPGEGRGYVHIPVTAGPEYFLADLDKYWSDLLLAQERIRVRPERKKELTKRERELLDARAQLPIP